MTMNQKDNAPVAPPEANPSGLEEAIDVEHRPETGGNALSSEVGATTEPMRGRQSLYIAELSEDEHHALAEAQPSDECSRFDDEVPE